MKTKFLVFLLLFICGNEFVTAQKTANTLNLNLDFEQNEKKEKLPDNWFAWGTLPVTKSDLAHSGDIAGKVTSKDGKGNFGCVAYKIPASYEGSYIRLTGYMKIENVKGFAGLMLRIDGNGNTLVFDNMQDKKIEGTLGWKKYTITLPYPDDAENIYIAGILSGKGTAWFDDFVLKIDGKDIQKIKKKEKGVYKASLDTAFDEGSKVTFPELTATKIADLEVLGKVWGFLKYHHPAIGKGEYNWDYELFRMLPTFLNAEFKGERDKILLSWIAKLGAVEKCSDCAKTDEKAILKPDMAWMDELNIGSSLKAKLRYIYNNRYQGDHYYIKSVRQVNNPNFINEKSYAKMNYPDAGFRLLTLYRYWNMIHYYFPYKYLTDKDWSTVLKDYIPTFINASTELEYEIAALRLIGDIQDTHAGLWGGNDKFQAILGSNTAPFKVAFVENKLVVTKYYNPEYKEVSKVKVGDVITHINGKTVEEIKKERHNYHPASNEPTKDRNMAKSMLRSPNKELAITYVSDGKTQQHTLPLYGFRDLNIYAKSNKASYKLLDNNIGYVTLETISVDDISKIKKQFKKTKGIIIDIRNYPAESILYYLGSYFVSKPTEFVKFSRMNEKNPGEFVMTEAYEISKSRSMYKGKLVVLVNEASQSHAEFTAMAFRAGENTTIVGSTTAGADGNVSTIILPGGLRTSISGIGVYYPDGGETQRIGIVPDVEVKPTIKGIKEGKDEVLEKAIEIILKE